MSALSVLLLGFPTLDVAIAVILGVRYALSCLGLVGVDQVAKEEELGRLSLRLEVAPVPSGRVLETERSMVWLREAATLGSRPITSFAPKTEAEVLLFVHTGSVLLAGLAALLSEEDGGENASWIAELCKVAAEDS